MEIQNTRTEFAVTLFRSLSIYSIIQALSVFAYRFPILSFEEDSGKILVDVVQVLGHSILLVIGGIVLWYLSPLLSNSGHRLKNEDVGCRLGSDEFRIIIFSAIGIFVIIDALPGIVDTALFYYQIHSLMITEKLMIAARNSALFSLLLQLVLGLCLIFCSHRITKCFQINAKTDKNRGNRGV